MTRLSELLPSAPLPSAPHCRCNQQQQSHIVCAWPAVLKFCDVMRFSVDLCLSLVLNDTLNYYFYAKLQAVRVQAIKAHKEVEAYLHWFVTTTPDRSEWSTLQAPAALLTGKNASTYWIWGWVGPREALDILETRNICCFWRETNSEWSSQ